MLDLFFETKKLGTKPHGSPVSPSLHLTRERELIGDHERYRRLVKKLNYLTVTHPEIEHSISVISRYMSSPTFNH